MLTFSILVLAFSLTHSLSLLCHTPQCLHRFEVWQSLFRRISSTTAELASISPRFNSNSVFLKCLCWKLSRGELALRDLIAARSDFAAEDDEQPKRLPQRQEKEADALLEAELERLYQDIEGCEARLKTEDVYRKQHELALAIVKALRSKKCAHLKVRILGTRKRNLFADVLFISEHIRPFGC